MVKKFFLSIIAILLLITNAEASNIKDHPTIAVMQFTDKAIKSNVEGIRGQDFSSASEY